MLTAWKLNYLWEIFLSFFCGILYRAFIFVVSVSFFVIPLFIHPSISWFYLCVSLKLRKFSLVSAVWNDWTCLSILSMIRNWCNIIRQHRVATEKFAYYQQFVHLFTSLTLYHNTIADLMTWTKKNFKNTMGTGENADILLLCQRQISVFESSANAFNLV